MVALILLSLVFLLLTSGLQFGTKAWSVGQEEPSKTSEVVTVQHLLRHVLSEARPLMIESTPNVRRHVFFAGNDNSIRFVAPMPEHLGIGGFYEVTVHLTERGESGNGLEMSWRLFRGGEGSSGPQVEEQRVALLDKVAQVQFAYFGNRGKNESARWYNDWQGLESLPDLIRMSVIFSEGDRIWPDLVVATMVRSLNPIIEPPT
jgi:general secretion pathway protein J